LAKETSFRDFIGGKGIRITPLSIKTLQVNITKLCNQSCVHCHVDSSPKRTEQMNLQTVNRCLEILEETDEIKTLDLTGGAPELNPHFDYFVENAAKLGKHITVRHNLTVTFDGNPVTGESKLYLPQFFAGHRVEVVSALPQFARFCADRRGRNGVFSKSVRPAHRLNERG